MGLEWAEKRGRVGARQAAGRSGAGDGGSQPSPACPALALLANGLLRLSRTGKSFCGFSAPRSVPLVLDNASPCSRAVVEGGGEEGGGGLAQDPQASASWAWQRSSRTNRLPSCSSLLPQHSACTKVMPRSPNLLKELQCGRQS